MKFRMLKQWKQAVILTILLGFIVGCNQGAESPVGSPSTNNSQVKQNVEASQDAEPSQNIESNQNIEGFKLIEGNGFELQVPNNWLPVNCFLTSRTENSELIDAVEVPLYVTCKLNDEVEYYSELIMYPYDRNMSFDEFSAEISVSNRLFPEKYSPVNVTNADAAYEWQDYQDTIRGKSSWEIIAFKNDICYKLRSYHDVNVNENIWPEDVIRNDIKGFRAYLDVMYPSFGLTKDGSTFNEITQAQ